MIAVDLQNHEILKNWEIKSKVAKSHPYGEWLRQHRKSITSDQLTVNSEQLSVSNGNGVNGNGVNGNGVNGNGHSAATKSITNPIDRKALLRNQMAFGYTTEDVEMIIQPMAIDAKEPTFCMGDDIPLAVLSGKPHLLYDYFKQRFAQVTNPPIDPLREKIGDVVKGGIRRKR